MDLIKLERGLPTDEWYRIPEREDIPTKADKSLIGTFWKVSRYIERVGYKAQPMDFDHWDVVKRAKQMITERVYSSLWSLEDPQRKKLAEYVVSNLIEAYGDNVLPLYRARGSLMQQTEGNKIRAIWYSDSKYYNQSYRYFMITGTARRMTGLYAPASSYTSWEGEYDYSPAYLENATHHTLFKGKLFCDFGSPIRFDEEYFQIWSDDNVLMHPLDLVEQVKETL